MDTTINTPAVTFGHAGAQVSIPEATIRELWLERAGVGHIQPPFGSPLRIGASTPAGVFMGIVCSEDGGPDYRLFDAGEAPERMNWEAAKKWTEDQGASLPTRREQAVMFGNRGEGQYKAEWYWSCEQYAGDGGFAWMQGFGVGGQGNDHKSDDCRARAVRREPIQ